MLQSLPAAAAGAAPASAASAWGYGSWVQLSAALDGPIAVYGIDYQVTQVPGLDATTEHVLEIGVGAGGAEAAQLQVPGSFRGDTLVGFYLTRSTAVMFAEPLLILAGLRVSVRAADDSTSAQTYGGFRLLFDDLPPVSFGVRVSPALQRAANW